MDCIFCKIARKDIPTEIVFEDENYSNNQELHHFNINNNEFN